MAQYDGSIRINTNIDTRGLRQGESDIRSSVERMKGSVKKMAAVFASAFAVGKLAQFGKEATRLGSDLQEVENIVLVAFPNMTKAMDDFAASAANSFGLSESMAKRYTSLFGTMAKQFNFTEKEAFEMGSTLAGLAGDVASFYDISQDLAYIKLKSVFSGETETLKDIGVVMTETALNQYALAKGINKTISKMTEQEKVALRYHFVLEQLSQASGDFIRTSNSWANQTRMLRLQFDSLKATLGQGLINVFTPVIKMINELLKKLAVLANSFKAFTELLTGRKIAYGGGAGAASVGLGDIADGCSESADAAENLADSTEKVAEATKDAQKAAEGYLSPLDEINNSSMDNAVPSASDGSGVGGAVDSVDYGNLAEGETVVDKLSDSLKAVIDRMRELAGLFKKGFFEGLGDYKPRLEELKTDILSIGQTLREIFTDPGVVAAANSFANQLAYSLGQITGSVASIGLTIAQNLVGGMEKYLAQNTGRIKEYIIEMLDIGAEISSIIGEFSVAFADIFSVFGGDTAQQITGNLIGIFAETRMMISENAAKLGRDILDMIAQPIIDNKDKIKDALGGTLEAIEPFTSGFLTATQTLRDAVSDVYDNHLKPLFDSVGEGLSEILGKLLEGYNTYMLPVFEGLGQKFQELMEGPFGEALEKISGFIGKLIDTMKLWWEGVLVPLFGWIASNIIPVLSQVVEYMGTKLLNILELVINVIGDTAEILGGLIDFITGIFTGDWEKAWSGVEQIFSGAWNRIVDIFTGVWDTIKGIVESGLELVATIIETAWKAVGSLTSTIWNAIKTVIFGVWNGIKTTVSSAINSVKTVISIIWNTIKTLTSTVWNGIKSVISGIWNGIKTMASNTFNGIKNAIVNVWENLKSTTSRIWDGIVRVVKDPINTIIGILNGLLSGMASAVNGIADMFNSMRIDIPDWVPGIGGGRLGFNLPHWTPGRIPYLATGTVVPPNREFMAVLGDNKREPEVVSPLSTIKQANRESLLEVLSELGLTGGSGTGRGNIYNIKAEANRRVLFELMIEEGKIQQMSTGRNPFSLGTT